MWRLRERVAYNAVATDETYVLECSLGDGALYTRGSDARVKAYDASSMRFSGRLETTGNATALAVSGSTAAVATADVVEVFDMRSGAVSIKAGRPRALRGALCSVALGASTVGTMPVSLASGTEQFGDCDAAVSLFDMRNPTKALRVYSEAHTDDVTQVAFHATQPNVLATAGMDGLVCVLDTTETDEDAAYLSVLNCESSVEHLSWFGRSGEYLATHTHDQQIVLFDAHEASQLGARLSVIQATAGAPSTAMGADFLISNDDSADFRSSTHCLGCHFDAPSGHLYAVCDTGGDLSLLYVNVDQLTVAGGLATVDVETNIPVPVHTAPTRCFAWHDHVLFTGAEDSTVCRWEFDDPSSSNTRHQSGSPALSSDSGKMGREPKGKGRRPY